MGANSTQKRPSRQRKKKKAPVGGERGRRKEVRREKAKKTVRRKNLVREPDATTREIGSEGGGG